MALTLTIENETSLPDGGPLSYVVTGPRNIDIGRDPYLDWALPDPTRTISGRHCEIRYRDGAYWVTDVSRNGTFLNRSDQRLQEPHLLRDGDRLEIGRYIICVRYDEAPASDPAGHPPSVGAADYWNASEGAAPPISPRELRPAHAGRPVEADFRDWAIDLATPTPGFAPLPPLDAGVGEDMSWAQGALARPGLPEPPEPPPVPTPRRPVSAELAGAPPPAPVMEDRSREVRAPWEAPQPRPSPPAEAANPWTESSGAVARSAGPIEPAGPARHATAPTDSDFIERLAKGAGVPPETFAWRDPGDLAEELGTLMRVSAENLKQLLAARAETKRITRSGGQTMIQALDNNPLKFSPTIEDALRIMFGRPSSGYLDARRAFEAGFKDLKTHQVKTYSAMQHALRLLMEDLEPEAIERSIGDDRGLAALVGSKKAKLWDLYQARWNARSAPHDGGMADAFLVFFAECYDRGSGDKGV